MSDRPGEQARIGKQAGEVPARLRALVLRPGDAGFDEVLRIWNGMISNTPALVVRPGSRVRCVRQSALARREGLPLSVRQCGMAEELGRAALAYAGRFTFERGASDRHVIPLLEDARAMLAEKQDAGPVRARVLAQSGGRAPRPA